MRSVARFILSACPNTGATGLLGATGGLSPSVRTGATGGLSPCVRTGATGGLSASVYPAVDGAQSHLTRPHPRISKAGLLGSVLGIGLLIALAGCDASGGLDTSIETSFAFTNFSTEFYAALRIRPHDDVGTSGFAQTTLLAPGATFRRRFADEFDGGCPAALDLVVLLYKRVNDDVPIGLDPTEQVEQTPVAAGRVDDIPACSVQPLETFTIVNWDAPEGQARVKLAQATPVDTAIRASGRFPNPDAAWEFDGVDPAIPNPAPPVPPTFGSIAGRVTLDDQTPVAGIGVLIRTRFRVRLNDDDAANDPDAGFAAPIDVTETDADGRFRFNRPPGGYRVEFFSDDFLFRPAIIDVEAPVATITTVVEPI